MLGGPRFTSIFKINFSLVRLHSDHIMVEGKDIVVLIAIPELWGAIFIEGFELGFMTVDPHEDAVFHI